MYTRKEIQDTRREKWVKTCSIIVFWFTTFILRIRQIFLWSNKLQVSQEWVWKPMESSLLMTDLVLLEKKNLDRLSSPWFKTLLFPLWMYLQSFGVLVQLHFYFLSVDEDCPRYREGGGEDGPPMAMPGVGKCKWSCRNNTLHCPWNDFTAPGATACSSLAEHIFRCSASHLSAPTAPLPLTVVNGVDRENHCTWP